MEIRRKVEVLVATNRRYTLRESGSHVAITCPICGEAMLNAERAADLFGISQRGVFRIIETEQLHYTETDSRAVLICLTSLAIASPHSTARNEGNSTVDFQKGVF